MPTRTGLWSRLILITVFYVAVWERTEGLVIKGVENRQKGKRQLMLEVHGGVPRAPERQLHGQAWSGPINSIIVLRRKGTGTYGSRTGLWLSVTCH